MSPFHSPIGEIEPDALLPRDTLHPVYRRPLIFLILLIRVAEGWLDRLQLEQLLQPVAHLFVQDVVGVLPVEVVGHGRPGRFIFSFGREFLSAVLPRLVPRV